MTILPPINMGGLFMYPEGLKPSNKKDNCLPKQLPQIEDRQIVI